MKPGKILILAERFYPEEFLINDLVKNWRLDGADIEVLTQTPSYPFDRIFEGYGNKLFQQTREFEDIPVHRVKTITGYNRSLAVKIFNYLNFALLTSLWAIRHGGRFDRVFVFHSGPLTMATAVLVLRGVWRRRCMIWTQDLWPDAVYAYGFRRTWLCRVVLNTFVRLIYSFCEVVSVSCQAFVGRLAGYVSKDVVYIPQWSPVKYSLAPKTPEAKVVFTFAGNIGSVQNLENVIAGFDLAGLPGAELWLVGGGVQQEALREFAQRKNCRNVVFWGRRPQAEMAGFFEKSDVLIISLKSDISMTVPAKFQSYIAAGRPLLGIIRGETAELIRRHDLGMAADPEDVAMIADSFKAMFAELPQKRNVWRDHALSISEDMFDRERLVARMTACLDRCAREELGGAKRQNRERRNA